jgi:predicted small secreted protein
MKTVKNNSEDVRRVDDSTAEMLVSSGSWFYCSKEEYKKNRKSVKVKTNNKTETKDIENRGLSDKKLRRERKRAKSNRNL